MLTIYACPDEESGATQPALAPGGEAVLADGTLVATDNFSTEELYELQFDQEQRFARAIQSFPAGSRERALTTAQAYDTICTILAAQRERLEGVGKPLVMGFDPRYAALVLRLLESQVARGVEHPWLFEIGYGSGTLLNEIAAHGFPVGGVEVSATMRDQAGTMLGPRLADGLLLGSFRDLQLDDLRGRPTVIYWNDVLEHISPDEAQAYVDHAYELLAPGGTLVTITPNWLLRPSDVTCLFHPQRTEACGLHLKEYRLGEVTGLLKQAGFRRIATPLLATRGRLVVVAGGFRWPKQLVEPLLDRLPLKLARLLCRGWAMSCTLAMK